MKRSTPSVRSAQADPGAKQAVHVGCLDNLFPYHFFRPFARFLGSFCAASICMVVFLKQRVQISEARHTWLLLAFRSNRARCASRRCRAPALALTRHSPSPLASLTQNNMASSPDDVHSPPQAMYYSDWETCPPPHPYPYPHQYPHHSHPSGPPSPAFDYWSSVQAAHSYWWGCATATYEPAAGFGALPFAHPFPHRTAPPSSTESDVSEVVPGGDVATALALLRQRSGATLFDIEGEGTRGTARSPIPRRASRHRRRVSLPRNLRRTPRLPPQA